MPNRHTIDRSDLLPTAEYGAIRRAERQRISAVKRNRRVEVGPFASFYFECFDTIRHQIHEMLHIEKGGEAQIADELDAYRPLVPDGNELVATVMFEIDEATRRNSVLSRLGGVEYKAILSIGGETLRGEPDETRENTSPEGKASSVQFIRFRFTPALKAAFGVAATPVLLGFDHPNYGHLAVMPEAVRQTLRADFA